MSEEQRPLSFVGAAAWTVGLVLVLGLAFSVTEMARPGAALDLVSVTSCRVLAYSAIILAMLRVHAPDTPVRQVVAFRSVPILVLALAVVLGAGLYPAASALDAIVARRFPDTPAELEALAKLMAASTLGRRVFLAATVVVIMPIAEEVYFRGLLFGGLRRGRTPGMVILGTSVCFVAATADERTLASALALGAMLGWLRDRTRSIVPTVLAQAAFFAVPVVPILRGRDPLADEVYPRTWIAAGLALAVLAAVALEWMGRPRTGRGSDEDGP